MNWTQDISDMSALREKLQEREQYYLDILEALPVAIYTTDAAGKITYYNRAAAELAGRRPKIGSDEWCVTWRLFWPDGTPMSHAECPMAVTLKEGRPIRGQEAVAERPDGTRVPFMPYPTPLFDAAGSLVGAVNLLMDITDQKRAQADAQRMRSLLEQRVEHRTQALADTADRLKESEQTFQLLVQSVTDYAIFMLDSEGRIANWNPGAERIKGYTRAEIIGEHFSRFYTEEDRLAGVPDQALATARREGRFEQENWRIRKDGTRFWASVVIDAIYDQRGALIGFAKVTRDLTERRMVEEKLRQSQKMDALGQLTGGIAHDFNNLLTVITGNLEVLGRSLSGARAAQPAAPRATRAIAAAMEGARRAAALTQRLLAFSRQQALQPKTIDPNRLVHRTVDMLRRTLGERVTIRTTLAPDAGRIHVDPVELENALLNLAVNARDAMPDGGTVTIETANSDGKLLGGGWRDEEGEPFILIAVRDTGVGMDRETLAKAFDPFFTTKGPGHGTGLGLSQVYGFVEQSGGHVLIDSQLGMGTTVRIFLPRLPDDAAELEANGEPSDVGEAMGSETILVVEDDDAARAYSTEVLRELGYHVLEAPNAGAALEILDRQADVHLLFTDIGLPGAMNGRQLSDEARRRRSGLKVLLATGYAGDATIHADRLEPGVTVMSKPFNFGDLTKRVRNALDG
jgi:PAS domain S-box-containing protein